MHDESDILVHYGVLGMKWGVRKAKRYTKKGAKMARRSMVEAYRYSATGEENYKNSSKKYLSKSKENFKKSDSEMAKLRRNAKSPQKKQLKDAGKEISKIKETQHDFGKALDEENKRERNKKYAKIAAVGAGLALSRSLVGLYGGVLLSEAQAGYREFKSAKGTVDRHSIDVLPDNFDDYIKKYGKIYST